MSDRNDSLSLVFFDVVHWTVVKSLDPELACGTPTTPEEDPCIWCCNLSVGVELNVRFTTNGMWA